MHDHYCPHCAFESDTELLRHLILDHNEKESSLFTCGECRYSTMNTMEYWEHRNNMHQNLIIKTPFITFEEMSKQQQCVYCGKKTQNMFVSIQPHFFQLIKYLSEMELSFY